MRILCCFGTRPEAIKMVPIIKEMQLHGMNLAICVTGQHREMLDQVLELFELEPDFDLDIMTQGQSLNGLSSEIFKKFDKILNLERPDMVLVHGDTTTSVMVAIASFHNGIKVGHVEAGLRTFNKDSPFPEEINRQITARLSSIHFAPTERAKANLLKENIPEANIFITGNTVVDALEWSKRKITETTPSEVSEAIGKNQAEIGAFILVTGHRRENFGEGLSSICQALKEISNEIQIIFPVHLNPIVRHRVYRELDVIKNIHLIKPVTYSSMLWLIKNCEFIISDSGGIQEEAPSFGKKVLVTRENSERPEGIESGFSVLVGSDPYKIVKEAKYLLKKPFRASGINPYGDGMAAKKIVSYLKNYLELEE